MRDIRFYLCAKECSTAATAAVSITHKHCGTVLHNLSQIATRAPRCGTRAKAIQRLESV